jgi:hypothetical protein
LNHATTKRFSTGLVGPVATGRRIAKDGRVSDLGWLLREQDGVIARRQAISAGLTATDVNRLIRRREWTPVHPGVYVEHTGPVSWLQRAWAAVLLYEPAGLSHRSALDAATKSWRSQSPLAPVHLAVARVRHLDPPPGVVVHRTALFDRVMEWNRHPPRIAIEHALLDVAGDAPDEMTAIATLADACGARRTTPSRLLAALDERPRVARRGWLRSVLLDLAEGTNSVLEHGYLTLVERAHRLPHGRRQVRAGGVWRDVDYEELRLVVELDGRQFHSSSQARDRDLDRDLDAAAAGGGRETIRLGYGQVFGRGCDTAVKLGFVMRRRGWTGAPEACARCR